MYRALTYMTYMTSTPYLSHKCFYGCISMLFSHSGIVVVGWVTCRVEFEGVVFPEFIQAAFEGVEGWHYNYAFREGIPLVYHTLGEIVCSHVEAHPLFKELK